MGINHDVKAARDALHDADRAVAEADRALQEALVQEYGAHRASEHRYTTKRLTAEVEALKQKYRAAVGHYHATRERR